MLWSITKWLKFKLQIEHQQYIQQNKSNNDNDEKWRQFLVQTYKPVSKFYLSTTDHKQNPQQNIQCKTRKCNFSIKIVLRLFEYSTLSVNKDIFKGNRKIQLCDGQTLQNFNTTC